VRVHDPGRQHRAKREISLGCGYEEREREKEKESRERERDMGEVLCLPWDDEWFFSGFFVFFVTAGAVRGRRSTNFVFCLLSLFAGRLVCVQDHAIPQLLQHTVDSCTGRARFNMRQSWSSEHTNS
jgi:hypothetical protein